jgi:hypothetical protein
MITLFIRGKIYPKYINWEFFKATPLCHLAKHRKPCYEYTMSVSGKDKLKTLLNQWQPRTLETTKHLKALGITPQHAQKYLASNWIERVGPGAFKRPNEPLEWTGALYSLQTQLDLPVHVGGPTALEAEGFAQYARMSGGTAYLFSDPGVALPSWVATRDLGQTIIHVQTNVLPADLGVTEAAIDGFRLQAATPERAILELLYLAPQRFDLIEAFQILEGMRTLRPKLMQSLLEACRSIKVVRLFLYMAERAALPIVSHLDPSRLNCGRGDRTLSKEGAYDRKYKLILPKELVSDGH